MPNMRQKNGNQKIDELKKTMTVSDIQEQIHDWWLDYQFTDGTEENLLAYIGG